MDIQIIPGELHLSRVKETGRELGRGAYGVVVEVEVDGLCCAAKKLHEVLLETNPKERKAITSRFVTECYQHSRQRHPNIVQLLGVHFPSPQADLPLMIIELMEMSLCTCLEKHPTLPVALKNDILVDVGQGLFHLHSQIPSIIHRDLTASNVLLTSQLRAKIADLGMAKIFKINPSVLSATQTAQPGTAVYMPPEALASEPSYNTKLDVFSFGVLVLHVFTNKWPIPTDQFMKSTDNPKLFYQVSEVERRRKYLSELGENHHHLKLVHSCLSDEPEARPTAEKALASLRTIKCEFETYPSRMEMAVKLASFNEEKREIMQTTESRIQELTLKIEKLEKENRQLLKQAKLKPNQQRLLFINRTDPFDSDPDLYIVKQDYITTQQGDLSVQKGEIIKVTQMIENGNWCRGEVSSGTVGWLPTSFITKLDSIKKPSWFFDDITRADAELVLSSEIKGSFLLRKSERNREQFVLSLRYGGRSFHYRIHTDSISGLYYIKPESKFVTLVELVKHYSKSSDCLPTTLQYPVPNPKKPEVLSMSCDLDEWEYERANLVMGQKVGGGQYGEVYKAVIKYVNIPVTAKTFREKTIDTIQFLKEAQVMKEVMHPNLVHLFGVCTKEIPFIIIMEYMQEGILLDFLQGPQGKNLQVVNMIYMLRQVASAMAYLEDLSIKHSFVC